MPARGDARAGRDGLFARSIHVGAWCSWHKAQWQHKRRPFLPSP
jgi:hypothetical protein